MLFNKNEAVTIEAFNSAYNYLHGELNKIRTEIKNEERIGSIISCALHIAETSTTKATACSVMEKIINDCIELIEINNSHSNNSDIANRDLDSDIKQYLERFERSIYSHRIRWQDLRVLSNKKTGYEVFDTLTDMMVESIRTSVKISIFGIECMFPVLKVSCNSYQDKVLISNYFEAFDKEIVPDLQTYIQERLRVLTRRNGTIKKRKEAEEMNSILYSCVVYEFKQKFINLFLKVYSEQLNSIYSSNEKASNNLREKLKRILSEYHNKYGSREDIKSNTQNRESTGVYESKQHNIEELFTYFGRLYHKPPKGFKAVCYNF
ncbi:hypothetical protein BXO88_11060 [Oribacterium sp. C9]|uniref:hypothetical protein n=1 Tax=Oribacterium sp. C9 TaxID=1943579 RepID=UPI000990178D|nr:hypothetical protein [Oribacterium sp. C9]OON85787.1 hypothetical protein BXO88_11060 [Oribacterium sp. C9]